MTLLIIGAVVLFGGLFVWSLCRAAALGDQQWEQAARQRDGRVFRHDGRTIIDLTRRGNVRELLEEEERMG